VITTLAIFCPAEVSRKVCATRLEQPPAPAERTFSDSVDHHVIGLIVLREVLRGAVDDTFGAQAARKLEVRGIADRGHMTLRAREMERQTPGRRLELGSP
jgi:hypothetical protein